MFDSSLVTCDLGSVVIPETETAVLSIVVLGSTVFKLAIDHFSKIIFQALCFINMPRS